MVFTQQSGIIRILKGMVLFVILFYGVITSFTCYLESCSDSAHSHVRLEEFSGIVVKKYDVEVEHHAPYIDITLPNKSIKAIGLNHYHDDVILIACVGDTIFTKSGDTVVHNKRKDTSFTVNKLIPFD